MILLAYYVSIFDMLSGFLGLALVLEVAAMAAPVLSDEKRTLQVSDNTRMHISVLLATVWDTLGSVQCC